MVNVADEAIKVWQPMQFVSHKICGEVNGKAGTGQSISANQSTFHHLRKKKADLEDLVSRSLLNGNVLPTC